MRIIGVSIYVKNTDVTMTPEEMQALKKRIRDARTEALATRKEAYATLHATLDNIVKTDDLLRELDRMDPDGAETTIVEAALDPATRKRLVRIDGSATDFAFSLIGLTEGGASAVTLQEVANEMNAMFTVGALHAALHRLVQAGWIVKIDRKKGSAYKLTRTGAHEWSEAMRRQHVAKE